MKHIYLNASEIAGLIGKNPYKEQNECIHNVLCRIKKEKNMVDVDKFNIIKIDELKELIKTFSKEELITKESSEILKKSLLEKPESKSEISKKLFELASADSINEKNTNNIEKKQKKLEEKLNSIVKTGNKELIKDYVGGYINKERGTKNEKKIIKDYEKITKSQITNNNDCLYKVKLFDVSDCMIFICGKIDGIRGDTLIEIKNRRNRLFTFIPEYEKIQIEIYLRLTGLEKCKLVQNYNEEQSSFDYVKDEKLWSVIKSSIKEVSENYLV